MIELQVEELNGSNFDLFGAWFGPNNPGPSELKILPSVGEKPVEYFPNLVPVNFGAGVMTYANPLRIWGRELSVVGLERHVKTDELILSLERDCVLVVAPPTPGTSCPNFEQLKAFGVKRGTVVVIRLGVWHCAPFLFQECAVGAFMVMLPLDTHLNDCETVEVSNISLDISGVYQS